jgi:hypothetical protein
MAGSAQTEMPDGSRGDRITSNAGWPLAYLRKPEAREFSLVSKAHRETEGHPALSRGTLDPAHPRRSNAIEASPRFGPRRLDTVAPGEPNALPDS